MASIERTIFAKGSTTYYWSSRFFPRAVRDDVFRLYSFVRVADDYVDAIPQQSAAFDALCRLWRSAITDPDFNTAVAADDTLALRVVKNMVYVSRKYRFDPTWADAFLASMQADLDGKSYHTLQDTLEYIYGSAEVIGLMMATILHLDPATYRAAQMQGRAMQYINFIRDIDEDNQLGRCYIPKDELLAAGLPDLSQATAAAHPEAFATCITAQLQRYHAWQAEATAGYAAIPWRLRIALTTAASMYNWTAKAIAQRPAIVFERKVKPSKYRVLWGGIREAMHYHPR
jgi:15-cis-phytoene synthase